MPLGTFFFNYFPQHHLNTNRTDNWSCSPTSFLEYAPRQTLNTHHLSTHTTLSMLINQSTQPLQCHQVWPNITNDGSLWMRPYILLLLFSTIITLSRSCSL